MTATPKTKGQARVTPKTLTLDDPTQRHIQMRRRAGCKPGFRDPLSPTRPRSDGGGGGQTLSEGIHNSKLQK